MKLFSNKKMFDKNFVLNTEFFYKRCICFSYDNIYSDGYVCQGFTITVDYCIISAYSKNGFNSRLYLYERNGKFKKFIVLDNHAHVGGIAYDHVNNIIYVTGSFGRVYAYDYTELISGNILKYSCDLDISKVLDGAVSAATIYFYNNSLYVSTCSDIGRVVRYDIEVNRNKKLIKICNYVCINNLPSCIQGVCVFEQNDKLYYIFSQSYSKLKSVMKLYDFEFKFLGQKVLDAVGLEGIDIDANGNIFGVFENGISNLKKVHVSELICSIKKTLEIRYIEKGKFHQSKLNSYRKL